MTDTSHLSQRSPIDRKRSRELSDNEIESSEEFSNLSAKLSKSCDYCKVKKVKCSGESPCLFCTKNNQTSTCTYSLMKKPGLKRGYGKDMIQRMDYLENLVLNLKDQIDSFQKSSRYVEDPISSSSTESPRINISDPSSLSPYSRVSPMTIQIPTLLNPPISNYIVDGAAPRIVINEDFSNWLPTNAICLDLFKFFFEKIIPIFPIVHPSFTEQLEKSLYHDTTPRLLVYAVVLISLKFFRDDAVLSQQERDKAYDLCKERVIQTCMKVIDLESLQSIALLAYESLNTNGNSPESWNYISLASDYVNHLKLYNESQHANNNLPRFSTPGSHSVSGVAPTLELPPISLLRKTSSSQSLSSLASIKGVSYSDLKRNVYWCVYNLDKFYSLSTLNDFKLQATQCNLPFKLAFWFNNQDIEPMSPEFQLRTLQSNIAHKSYVYDSFADIIELNSILGKVHLFTKQLNGYCQYDINQNSIPCMDLKIRFKNLESDLKKWLSSLPLSTRNFLETANPISANQNIYQNPQYSFRQSVSKQLEIFDILLFVQYYTVVIKLHSAIAYPNLKQLFLLIQLDPQASINQCLQASSKTYQLLSNLRELTGDKSIFEKLGPVFGYGLFFNARVLIVNMIHNHKLKLATPQTIAVIESHCKILQQYQAVLQQIGVFWKSSRIYASIIQNVDLLKLYHIIQNNASQSHEDFLETLSGGNRLVYWLSLLLPQIERALLKPGSSLIINPNSIQFSGRNALSYDEVWNVFVSDSLEN